MLLFSLCPLHGNVGHVAGKPTAEFLPSKFGFWSHSCTSAFGYSRHTLSLTEKPHWELGEAIRALDVPDRAEPKEMSSKMRCRQTSWSRVLGIVPLGKLLHSMSHSCNQGG